MFTVEEVSKIASLSSLELTKEETESFAEQFTSILEYFDLLKTAEVSEDLVETALQIPEKGRLDERKESSFTPEIFSPYIENGFFKVPRVIDPGN